MKKIFFISLLISLIISCHHKINSSTSIITGKPLENTKWRLTVLNGLPDSMSLLTKIPFMQLDTGRVMGFGGCNNYFGGYKIENTTIYFTGIASTKMFCAQGAAIEDALFRVLNTVDNYRISGTHLELLKDTKLLAGFEAE